MALTVQSPLQNSFFPQNVRGSRPQPETRNLKLALPCQHICSRELVPTHAANLQKIDSPTQYVACIATKKKKGGLERLLVSFQNIGFSFQDLAAQELWVERRTCEANSPLAQATGANRQWEAKFQSKCKTVEVRRKVAKQSAKSECHSN